MSPLVWVTGAPSSSSWKIWSRTTFHREWLVANTATGRKHRQSVLAPCREDHDSQLKKHFSSGPVVRRSCCRWVLRCSMHTLSLAMGPGVDVFPLDQDMPQDTGLTHAATYTGPHRAFLAQRRSESIRPVRALSARQWPTSLHVQKVMHPHVYKVSTNFHIGCGSSYHLARLLAPDALRCGILHLRPLGTHPSPVGQSLRKESCLRKLPQRRGRSDGVVGGKFRQTRRLFWRSLARKTSREASSAKDELDRKHGTGRWLAMERLEISQGTGDSRAIGDGAKLGHASGAGHSETLDFCTAVPPAFQARVLMKALDTLGVPQNEQISGSDDLPSAY